MPEELDIDHLTGLYTRDATLAMLFRETDRVQRHNNPLSLVLFDIDDFTHWNSRLGAAACDTLLYQIAVRTNRLLRSYDLLGRNGADEFLIALPGCCIDKAVILTARLRSNVFNIPFQIDGEPIRLSACFGIARSQGRSPLVVLREAEESLQYAKANGPESIHIWGESTLPTYAPITYLLPESDAACNAR